MVSPPVAVGLTLCDYVLVEERTRKVSLIGSFTGIGVLSFPAVVPPFSVFAVLTDGLGNGTIELGVSRLDTNEQVANYRTPVHFPDKLAEVFFHIRLHQCSFPAPGHYQFTLLADGQWLAQRRIRVYTRGDES